ncbi:MAG: hypothetical protein K8R18_10975 [Parvibaculum sp.]|uniref:hypothetical protein n=1 Tax=Parvibaculum sp. TaxID=2024848 RepID=UPI0025D4B139|nr:hypothetical protein [Parvibaculum sp.]MCE9650133.1 hypothetical protein [Parvibaculum sp.]
MADVLAILLTPDADAEAGLHAVRALHGNAKLTLLTTPDAAPRLTGLADEIWSEARARGPGRFLALMRRISWVGFTHVYDLEASPLTRIMRFCVWPRPKWHLHRHVVGL